MNILLITQEYPADDIEKEFTPVVHFFAKEWKSMGHNVCVVNLPSNFPSVYYAVAKPFRRKLESYFGTNIRMYTVSKRQYVMEGVHVLRYPLNKMKPHGRFSFSEINKAIEASKVFCNSLAFSPDVIIGHWTNPVVEVMLGLKVFYNVPSALVMHDDGFDFRDIYSAERERFFSQIDMWGWRSYPLKREFEKQFGVQRRNFMCFSGVPEQYIVNSCEKEFNHVSKFLFVGLLLKRKHPFEYLKALEASQIKDYTLDIVGQGDEKKAIETYIKEHPQLEHCVNLLGRIPRDEVSKRMSQSDVFCMISENETFGLVYIEAMAAGCITIASKNEGFDGIIKDGINGFLCEAGNVEELTLIINKIAQMTPKELQLISIRAKETASKMTDKLVAKQYIEDVEKYLKKINQ